MDYYRLTDKDTPVREENIGVWWDWYCNAPADWINVASTVIDNNTAVITFYYGKNESMLDAGNPPLLWRSDLCTRDKREFIWGYATRAEAEAEHKRAVRNERFRRGEAGVTYERRNRSITGRFRRFVKGIYKTAK